MFPVSLRPRHGDDRIELPEVGQVLLIPNIGNDMKAVEFLMSQDSKIPRWVDRPVEGSIVLVDPEIDDDVLLIDLGDWPELDAPENAFPAFVIPAGPLEVAIEDVVVGRPGSVEDVVVVGDDGGGSVDSTAFRARSALDDVVRRQAGKESEAVLLCEEPRGDILEKIVAEPTLVLDLNAHVG